MKMTTSKNIVFFLLFLVVAATPMHALSPAANAADSTQLAHIFEWVLIGAASLVVIIAIYYGLLIARLMLSESIAKAKGLETVAVVKEVVSKESWIDKLIFQLFGTGAVAIEKEEDIMLAHAHDGIYELDNQLPPWWVSMFYATIVFAFVYIGYYHFSATDRGQLAYYKQEMKELSSTRAAAAALSTSAVNEETAVALTAPADLASGKSIFVAKCAACHGQAGEGIVGPNFTDEYWIHGGGIKNIFKVVRYGVPEKGMISWAGQLTMREIQEVGSYILTLKGTNPPNQKAAQGDKYDPATEVVADTTAAVVK